MSISGQDNAGGESVKDWTETQANQITSLYKSLHGNYQEEANKRLFGGPQLPYEEAHSMLMEIKNKQDGHKHGGLEHSINTHTKKYTPAMDLGAIAASAGLAAVTHPVIGVLAGLFYFMSKYYSSSPKSAHP